MSTLTKHAIAHGWTAAEILAASDDQPERYEQVWRNIGGGAPALIDTTSGSILAGCPGLEDEDLDEIGAGEDPEHREARNQRQEKAEQGGYLSQATKDARKAWKDAKLDAPEGTIVLLRAGDDLHAFGADAKTVNQITGWGDGDLVDFDHSQQDRVTEALIAKGHRVAIATRKEHGGADVEQIHEETADQDKEGDRAGVGVVPSVRQGAGDLPEPDSEGDRPGAGAGATGGGKEEEAGQVAPKKKRGRPAIDPRLKGIPKAVRAEIAQTIGTEHPEMIAGFYDLLKSTRDRMSEESETYNDGLRQTLGNFGYSGQRQHQFIHTVKKWADKGKDYSDLSIKAFKKWDQLTEHAETYYPFLLNQGESGEMQGAGGDAGQQFFEAVTGGFRKKPGIGNEAVWADAFDNFERSGGLEYDPDAAPDDQDTEGFTGEGGFDEGGGFSEDEAVPFSLSPSRWFAVVRYRASKRSPWLAEHYRRESPQILT